MRTRRRPEQHTRTAAAATSPDSRPFPPLRPRRADTAPVADRRHLSSDTLRSLHAYYAHEREHGRGADDGDASTTPPKLRALITREREVGGLRRLPSLSTLDEMTISALASKLRTRVILASEPMLVQYGELVSDLFLVTRGSVEISAPGVTRGSVEISAPGVTRGSVEISAPGASARPTSAPSDDDAAVGSASSRRGVHRYVALARGLSDVAVSFTRGLRRRLNRGRDPGGHGVRCSFLRADWRGPGSVLCEAAVFMPSRSGVEIRADFAEVRLHGHHAVITRSSRGHHMVITRSSHGHHAVITRSSRGHHMAITRSSHGHHVVITWSSHGHHAVITWSSHGHHMAITWSSRGHHVLTRADYAEVRTTTATTRAGALAQRR